MPRKSTKRWEFHELRVFGLILRNTTIWKKSEAAGAKGAGEAGNCRPMH